MFNKFKDVLMHTKSESEGTESVEKITFPITRWENVLGAPRMLTKETLDKSFPSEYAFFETEQIAISDEEYEACFADL